MSAALERVLSGLSPSGMLTQGIRRTRLSRAQIACKFAVRDSCVTTRTDAQPSAASPSLARVTTGRQWDYFRLGTEQGGNLSMWHDAIALQTQRVRDALAAEREPAHRREDTPWRLDIDAHSLLIAIRNGLRMSEQLLEWVPDPKLIAALEDFPRRFPHAKDLRDVMTHLDEYIRGHGRLQRSGSVDAGSNSWRATTKDGEVMLVHGPFVVPLLAVGNAAEQLLALAVDVWDEGLRNNVDGLDQT